MQANIKSNTAAGTFALFSLYNQITCDTTRALGMFLALSEEAYSNSHSLVIADRVSSGEVRVQLTLEEAVHTRSNADHCSQALISFPHDDGSQDLPSKQTVLDASSEGVEALVAQHSHLIM